MHISARAEYATRALLTLAPAEDTAMTAEQLAIAQGIPIKFLENILRRRPTQWPRPKPTRGRGGYRLGRPANQINIADVLRHMDGSVAEVRGAAPEDSTNDGPAEHLQEVWVAARAALRSVLEHVTLADVVAGRLPRRIATMAEDPDAWAVRAR